MKGDDRMKRIWRSAGCVVLVVLLLLSTAAPVFGETGGDTAGAVPDNGLSLENDRLSMTADPSNGFFAVTDRKTGMTYYSNPPDYAADPLAQGLNLAQMVSQLTVRYLNENKAIDSVNSYVGATADGNLSIRSQEQSLVFTYTFPEQGFVIPMICSLTEDSLLVTIDYAHVEETGDCRILEIALLPHFGSARDGDAGCILLPDGAGSYIGFHNGRFAQGEYRREIYGGDLTQVSETKPNEYKRVMLPMYAMLYSHAAPLLDAASGAGRDVQAGFVAAIRSGAAGASVTAAVAGYDTSFDTASFSFLYRTSMENIFLSRTWAEIKRIMLADKVALPDAPQVEYRFLSGEEASIRGAATVYASSLFGRSASAQSLSDSLYLDIVAGVRTQQQFLGFGYQGITPLTTLSQTGDILRELRENGIDDPIVRLRGLDDSGAYYGRIDNKLSVDRHIGTYKQLQQLAKDNRLYPEVQLTQFTRNGNGVWSFFHSVTSVNKKTSKLFDYHYATGMRDYDLPTRYLLRPAGVARAVAALKKNLTKKKWTTLAPTSLATDLYGNAGGRSDSIGEVQKAFEEHLQTLADTCSLLLEAPNAYAMPYADALIAIPHTDSGHFVCDGSVPFVQMVLDGMCSYAVPAINYAADPRAMLLHAIESNSALNFSVMAAEYEKIARTSLNNRYASEYAQWKDTILEMQAELAAVRKRTENTTIADYRFIDSELRSVTFGNGEKLYVNYGVAARTVGGTTVPACSYTFVGEEDPHATENP